MNFNVTNYIAKLNSNKMMMVKTCCVSPHRKQDMLRTKQIPKAGDTPQENVPNDT